MDTSLWHFFPSSSTLNYYMKSGIYYFHTRSYVLMKSLALGKTLRVIINVFSCVISRHENQYEGQWEPCIYFYISHFYQIASSIAFYYSLVFNLFQPSHLVLLLFLFVNSHDLFWAWLISFTSSGIFLYCLYSFIVAFPTFSEQLTTCFLFLQGNQ